MKLLIGELSNIFGISTDTLRYYDKIGVLKASINPDNNYRYYLLQDIEKLELILGIRDLGVSLSKIKETIENENLEEYKNLIEIQKVMINRKIETLKELKVRLNNSIAVIDNVAQVKNKYNFEELEIFYKKFTLYSVHIKSMLETVRNIKNNRNLGHEINVLDSQHYRYIYNLVDNKRAIEDEENLFIVESKVTKRIFLSLEKEKSIDYSIKNIEGDFISVDFYGSDKEIKEYILKLNKYFNDGKDVLVVVKFKFYLPRKAQSEYFVNIEVPLIT
ncbi:MAG: MerR family transcriptional regulator [Sarcina sp.]